MATDPRDPEGLVLAWVNKVREDRDFNPLEELPEDYLGEGVSFHCPMAQAIGMQCGLHAAGFFKDDTRIDFPEFITAFIKAHDDRRIAALSGDKQES